VEMLQHSDSMHGKIDESVMPLGSFLGGGDLDSLSGRLSQCKFHGTSHGPTVKPAIRVYPNGLTLKLLEIARFMDRLQQREQA
jgi:hypothetical protein